MTLTAHRMPSAAVTRGQGIEADWTTVRAAHELWFARTSPPATLAEGHDIEDRKWPERMRHQSRGLLEHWELEGLIDRVDTVLTELVNNALVHGGGASVGFRMTLTEAGLLVEVADSAPDLVSHVVYDEPEEHGRGLLLVDAFADDWGTRPRDVGKWTWAAFAVPARTEGAR
ncbi:ATP-binding protein [Streptomyces sp. NPDC002506]|uniref:ATP-binding protein n=1 Tax=Streptomyces sp. NPDC002506 TaxID=3154536 RepID=UPI003316A886